MMAGERYISLLRVAMPLRWRRSWERAEDQNGWRPVHYAARNGHGLVLAKLFVAIGADLAAETKAGASVLQLAESGGHPGAAEAILAAGGVDLG